MRKIGFILTVLLFSIQVFPQSSFNGLDMNLGNLYRLSDAKTRSISPENFTGEKGKGGKAIPDPDAPINTANASRAAGDLGQGWKVNPFIRIQPGETFTLAEIEGPGAIQHIWMTPTGNRRFSIIRIYWDDETHPSVEVPINRTNPNLTSDYTIIDNIRGKGHYVGTYMAWGVNNNGWWGEGEVKFFMDGGSIGQQITKQLVVNRH